MDTSTILAIVGTIATVIFGILGVYLVKKQYYSSRINLVIESSIGLFDFIQNWKELVVKHNNNTVPDNLVLLVGIWRNTGSVDITRHMIDEKLALKLDAGFKWLDGKVISTNSKVKAKIIVDPSSLEFDYQLFKGGEHIRFEALAEVPSTPRGSSTARVESAGVRLRNALIIDYRIQNTREGIVEDLVSLGLASKSRMRKSALASVLVLAFSVGVSFMFPATNQGQTYLMKDSNGKESEVKIDFSIPGSYVDVTDLASAHTQRLSLSEVKRRGYAPAPNGGVWTSFIFPLVPMILALIAIFLINFYVDKKKKRDFSWFLASCKPYPPHSQLVKENMMIEGDN